MMLCSTNDNVQRILHINDKSVRLLCFKENSNAHTHTHYTSLTSWATARDRQSFHLPNILCNRNPFSTFLWSLDSSKHFKVIHLNKAGIVLSLYHVSFLPKKYIFLPCFFLYWMGTKPPCWHNLRCLDIGWKLHWHNIYGKDTDFDIKKKEVSHTIRHNTLPIYEVSGYYWTQPTVHKFLSKT